MDTLQLVAEPRRQEILRLVWPRAAGRRLVERIDLTYAGVSQHLALLRDAGLVTVRRDGKQRFYRADLDGSDRSRSSSSRSGRSSSTGSPSGRGSRAER